MRVLLLAVLLLARACAPTAEAQTSGPWTPHVLSHPYRGADGLDVRGGDIAVAWEAGRQLTVTSAGHAWHPYGMPTRTVDWYGGQGRGYEDVRLVDVDGDQAFDVVGAAEAVGRGVHVFTGAAGSYSRARWSELHDWQTVTSCDLDGDGDEDIVAAGGDVLWWWRVRPDAAAGAWSQRQIATPGRALWIGCADMDGDGDTDVLWTDREGSGLTWGANPGDPVPIDPWPVTSLVGGAGTMIACAGDLDGDGDDDYGVPRVDGTLAWYETGAGIVHAIAVPWATGGTTLAMGCAIADLDADGLVDLVVTLWDPDSAVTPERVRVLWAMQAWETIDATVLKPNDPAVLDANGDGALDVCVTDEGEANSAPGGGLVCLEGP
jgi:hypothetical protein